MLVWFLIIKIFEKKNLWKFYQNRTKFWELRIVYWPFIKKFKDHKETFDIVSLLLQIISYIHLESSLTKYFYCYISQLSCIKFYIAYSPGILNIQEFYPFTNPGIYFPGFLNINSLQLYQQDNNKRAMYFVFCRHPTHETFT